MHQTAPLTTSKCKKLSLWEGTPPSHTLPPRSLHSLGLGRFAPSQVVFTAPLKIHPGYATAPSFLYIHDACHLNWIISDMDYWSSLCMYVKPSGLIDFKSLTCLRICFSIGSIDFICLSFSHAYLIVATILGQILINFHSADTLSPTLKYFLPCNSRTNWCICSHSLWNRHRRMCRTEWRLRAYMHK